MSDEQQLERLEKKVDDGFADNRAEFQAVRAEMNGIHRSIHSMWLTIILGFAAMIVGQHL